MPGSSLGRHLESGVDPGNEVGRGLFWASPVGLLAKIECDLNLTIRIV